VADRVVYPKLRATFGGRCVAAFTAGAPLDEQRVNFFRGIGVDVHQLETALSE
jgi:long-chain acyl-CoA synthetase